MVASEKGRFFSSSLVMIRKAMGTPPDSARPASAGELAMSVGPSCVVDSSRACSINGQLRASGFQYSLLEHASRVARNDRPWRHVARHDRTRAHHRAAPDADAGGDER